MPSYYVVYTVVANELGKPPVQETGSFGVDMEVAISNMQVVEAMKQSIAADWCNKHRDFTPAKIEVLIHNWQRFESPIQLLQ